MTDLHTENARLRAALERTVAAYDRSNPMRLADQHRDICDCLRCATDEARAALATPAPDTRKEVMPDDEPTLSHARPDTSPGVTAGAPAPDAVQEAARGPEIAALIEAADNLMLNYLQDELCEPDLCVDDEHWAAIHDFNAALRAIAGDRT